MNNPVLYIIKRDGGGFSFAPSKIENAILKAYVASGKGDYDEVQLVTRQVLSRINQTTISVEEVQDIVESELMKVHSEVAKRYIIYREHATLSVTSVPTSRSL